MGIIDKVFNGIFGEDEEELPKVNPNDRYRSVTRPVVKDEHYTLSSGEIKKGKDVVLRKADRTFMANYDGFRIMDGKRNEYATVQLVDEVSCGFFKGYDYKYKIVRNGATIGTVVYHGWVKSLDYNGIKIYGKHSDYTLTGTFKHAEVKANKFGSEKAIVINATDTYEMLILILAIESMGPEIFSIEEMP